MSARTIGGIAAPWVKVCGLRDAATGAAAVDAGANLLGCVLEPTSPRHVTLDHALALHASWRDLPCAVVAVLIDLPWDHPLLERWPGPVQVHGQVAPAVLTRLQERGVDLILAGPDALERDPRLADGTPARTAARLLDHAQPGSGLARQWTGVRALVEATPHPVIIAGGIGPDNVAACIRDARPAGVDASSRLESERGVKSMELIHAYVAAARSAFGY